MIAMVQPGVVADGGDKARQFVVLVNSFREFGEQFDRCRFIENGRQHERDGREREMQDLLTAV